MITEHAIYCNCLETLSKQKSRNYKRLYFGSEFCAQLLPSSAKIKEFCQFADNNNCAITFVTPIAQNSDLDIIDNTVQFLNNFIPEYEIVFNDWGVYDLLQEKFEKVPLIMGRVLHKMKHDPLYYSQCPDDEYQEYIAYTNVSHPDYRIWLQKKGITRIECNYVIQPFSVPNDFHFSLYYPYSFVSTTISCPARNLDKGNPPNCFIPCQQECQEYFLIVRQSSSYPIYHIGNTCYFKNTKNSNTGLDPSIDRLVYQPILPHCIK